METITNSSKIIKSIINNKNNNTHIKSDVGITLSSALGVIKNTWVKLHDR